MKLGWAFFALAVFALVGYSLDRGIYIGSRTLEDTRERDRVEKHAQEKLERDRAEHANDPSWLPTVKEAFPDLPKRSFVKYCHYLYPSGVHSSLAGGFSEDDYEPPCRLFERR
jgi:hypothetical protein